MARLALRKCDLDGWVKNVLTGDDESQLDNFTVQLQSLEHDYARKISDDTLSWLLKLEYDYSPDGLSLTSPPRSATRPAASMPATWQWC